MNYGVRNDIKNSRNVVSGNVSFEPFGKGVNSFSSQVHLVCLSQLVTCVMEITWEKWDPVTAGVEGNVDVRCNLRQEGSGFMLIYVSIISWRF